MIVYNKTEIENNLICEEAKNLFELKFISKEKLQAILSQFTTLKTSENWFIRFGFFLLGCFLYSSILGSISFFFIPLFEHNYKLAPFIYFLFGVVGTEFFTRQNYFRHGLDDAFILGLQLCLCLGFGLLTESFTVAYITMFIIGFICSVRYIHTLSAISSCIGMLLSLFFAITTLDIINAAFLPLFGVLLAVLLFFANKTLIKNTDFYIYKNALEAVRIFSFLLAYFSLNYLVVRQLSEELLNVVVAPKEDIPFATIFYVFTFIIPVVYFYFALLKKDRIVFYISIITFCFSIFTIRFYYSILPIEIALTLGGILLFLVSFFSIKILKKKTTGITFQSDRNSKKSMFLNAQAILINSEIDINNQSNQQNMEFGGGGFSGGGANESF
jgi:uncharacterized membrane protein YccF (DUF307 family)